MSALVNLDTLVTERENANARDLDLLPTDRLLDLLNTEDTTVAIAVRRVLPEVGKVVDACAERFARGGRMLYIGAGTSARVAYMDASECPPTFGVDPSLFQVAMAGGRDAVFQAKERVEDGANDGAAAVREWGAKETDCVIGIAASGRTPYVLRGLEEAHSAGAFTALICNNPVKDITADIVISCITGPEALTGSTRLKAGTSAKMILNMISTAVMIRMGRTYGNHMCYIKASNEKLASRSVDIIRECCGFDKDAAVEILEAAGGSLALAMTMALSGENKEIAERALAASDGHIREAVKALLNKQ